MFMPLDYARYNLRRNPFGEPPDDEARELLVIEGLEELREQVQHSVEGRSQRCVMQFVGHCGRGKSAHMRALHAHFSDAPWLYFAAHEPHPKLPAPTRTPLLFLDETQRLSWFVRQRLWRSACTLIIATHRDHRKEFFARNVRFIHRDVGGLTRELLDRIIRRRFHWAARDPSRPVKIEISPEQIDALIARHGDDLRAILATLYELVQHMRSPGPLTQLDTLDLSHIEASAHRPLDQPRFTFTSAHSQG